MTSKSSSSKSLVSGKWFFWDCIKRTQWVPIISSIAFLLLFVLQGVMCIQNAQRTITELQLRSRDITDLIMSEQCYQVGMLVRGGNYMITLLLVLMVTASAIAAFQYLHSKQKVDLYHSLAISRSKQFVCRFVSGLLNVLIPFVISFGILVAMIYAVGFAPYIAMKEVALYFIVCIITAIFVYTSAVLSMILCGNTFISLLMHGWILFSPYVIRRCVDSCMMNYFQTFTSGAAMTAERYSVVSAAVSYPNYLQDMRYTLSDMYYRIFITLRETLSIFAIYLVVAIVGALLAYWLYQKRPSEKAGNAIAFPAIMVPLRIYMCCVFGAGAALMIGMEPVWTLVGVAIGVIICNMIVSVVYTFDYRKMITKPLYIPICVVIVLAFGSLFKYDVFGYDTWLPERSEIVSVGFDEGVLMPKLQQEELIDGVYHIAEAGVKQLSATEEEEANLRGYTYVRVSFRMNNGKTKYRQYQLPLTEMDLVRQLAQSEEYKKAYWLLYQMDAEDIAEMENNGELLSLQVSSGNRSQELKNVDQIAEIWRTLQEEALLRPAVVKPMYGISLDSNQFWAFTCVMDSDVKTRALIEEYAKLQPFTISAEDVREMQIEWSIFDEDATADNEYDFVHYQNYRAEITDTALIEAVLEHGFVEMGYPDGELYTPFDQPYIMVVLDDGASHSISFNYLDYPEDVIDACFAQAEEIGDDWY